MTATEVARNFAEVLRAVEHDGETVVITLHGRRVATLGPAPAPTGRILLDLLRDRPADEMWVQDVEAIRILPTRLGASAWDD
jgi:prevent-host-death family protein